MGCGSCGSGGCSSVGCGQNGGCATGGCNKLNAFDWLGNMLSPDQTEADNIYEVRFKNTRKNFYRNVHGLRLNIGDLVVVESDRGYDTGTLSLGGVMARLQMKKKKVDSSNGDVPRIYRKANERDLELLEKVRDKEKDTRLKTRLIIEELRLDMKLTDVEFQGDETKAIFYYIADHRVDFRELIKRLAREFRIRVEMKQIGLRHEAGLVGGIGSCGRELCCSTWLTDFKTVSTTAARYQNLSLNPMKISGLCGRLKCCLNYELDTYLDALQDFPEVHTLETQKGKAILQKTDIFKRKMWFSYEGETTWYAMSVKDVKEVVAMNAAGKKPEAISNSEMPEKPQGKERSVSFDFVDVVGTNIPKSNPQRKQKKHHKRKQKHSGNKQGRGPNANNKQQSKGPSNAQNQQRNNPQSKSGGNAKKSSNKPNRKPNNRQKQNRDNNK